jgi:hypothetical protein
MHPQYKQPKQAANNSSVEELNAAKNIFTSLLLACKNLSLYPPGHTICNNSINQLHLQLTAFHNKYGTLRLEIERERVISNGGLICEGLPDEGTLHFTLFQVGLRWLDFLEGIELEELNNILTILDKYTKLSAEPEGDIVTALWEAQFPHLRYEVAEFSWGDDPEEVKEISDLAKEKAVEMQLRGFEWEEPDTQIGSAIDLANLVLTSQEDVLLKELIRQEEEPDPTSYLDALMDSLLQHREKGNLNIILEVLSEEFTGSLTQGDLMGSHKILKGLRYVLDIYEGELPWAGLLIEEFFLKASGPESLAPLKEIWGHLDPENTGIIEQIFRLFNPQAIHTLVPLLTPTQPAHLRQILLDSIIFLASQDMRSLESMLNSPDEMLVENLVPVIVNIKGGQSLKYLKRLIRHPSSKVRREAVKGFFQREPARGRDIFPMIDDKDESIRQLVLEQLGQSRDETVEDLLLSYLHNIKIRNQEENHLIQCFKTLGECGSARSIPFLRETLFKRAWMPGFGRSVLRRGAVTALVELDIPEAQRVLKDAGRSLFPSVRAMVRKNRQESRPRGDRKHVE